MQSIPIDTQMRECGERGMQEDYEKFRQSCIDRYRNEHKPAKCCPIGNTEKQENPETIPIK